jgi:hypothetical protein
MLNTKYPVMLVAGIPGLEYPVSSICHDAKYEISCHASGWDSRLGISF